MVSWYLPTAKLVINLEEFTCLFRIPFPFCWRFPYILRLHGKPPQERCQWSVQHPRLGLPFAWFRRVLGQVRWPIAFSVQLEGHQLEFLWLRLWWICRRSSPIFERMGISQLFTQVSTWHLRRFFRSSLSQWYRIKPSPLWWVHQERPSLGWI